MTAERLHLAPSTVSGLVTQLLASELIERGTDSVDRRAAVVSLSPAGYQQLARWVAANQRRIRAALEQLDSGQRRAIAEAIPALDQLTAHLDEPLRG